MNLWVTCNMAKKTKTVKCLNCKCEFESEIDKMGVPYNRLCEKHRYLNENEAIYFAKDLLGLNKPAAAIFYLRELIKKYPKSVFTGSFVYSPTFSFTIASSSFFCILSPVI